MAAKVFLRSIDQKSLDKVKRSGAESLVRQLLAVKVSQWLYQRLMPKSTKEIDAANPPNTYIPWGLEPSIDAQIGVIVAVPSLPGQVRYRAF